MLNFLDITRFLLIQTSNNNVKKKKMSKSAGDKYGWANPK